MASPLFRASGLNISPQLAGERSITADPKTGEMLLKDPVAGHLRLSDLQGLRRLPGSVTAGPGGDYSSVSDAVAAAVAATDPKKDQPASVILMPGLVVEHVEVPAGTWVNLAALGRCRILAGRGNPALRLVGGILPTRVGLRNIDLVCAGSNPAIVVEGGIGGITLDMADCSMESQDLLAPAMRADGLVDATLLRCGFFAVPGSAAFAALGQINLRATSCGFRGDVSVETSGTWLLDRSHIEGACYLESTALKPSRFWGSRIEGALLFSGIGEFVGCDIGHLSLVNGSQVEASLSKLRQVVSTSLASLNVDRAAGVISFSGVPIVDVKFEIPRIDDAYEVSFTLRDRPAGDEVPWLSSQDKDGFQIRFLSAQALSMSWTITTL